MKKLKLEIDALVVESFDAGAAPARLGTVHGLDYDTPFCDSVQICGPTDPSYVSCEATCDLECTGSCQYSACYNGQTCQCATTDGIWAPEC